ncbi:serine acetyltransferase [Bifidobacterium callitrichos]|uniref:Serine acetyltransferase n=1 Tax=Bifidobacterium callitrichos TaxID=762209 RepID=A0A5M9Z9S5_9BIFI|nr:serine acetyltransferase [Bifidobacterium callitrichos]
MSYIYIPIDFSESQVIGKILYQLRWVEYHTNNNHRIRALYHDILLNRLENRYGIHIHPNTCGKGLSIAHLGIIIINDKAHIGDNLRIHVGVVIGKGHDGVPQIGNNVYIGPGAKIFGNIYISDNCKIGANAVVNHSCQTVGATLVGIPAKEH